MNDKTKEEFLLVISNLILSNSERKILVESKEKLNDIDLDFF